MPTAAAVNNFRQTAEYLNEFGLSALFKVDARGNPGGWLWNQILSGVDTPEELRIAIESTDIWRDQFGVIVEQRNRASQGQPVRVWTPQEVVAYRESVRSELRRYGLPSWFMNTKAELDRLILENMSVAEVSSRIGGAYDAVANAPDFVRQEFERFYGVGQGRAALAAYFLDPELTERELDRQALAAYAGGIAKEFNLTLDRGRAELFSDLGYTERGVSEALSNINTLSPVLRETFTETEDLTERDAFDATVRGSGDVQSRLESRIIRRRAVDQSSQGGALFDREGLTGVSSAR